MLVWRLDKFWMSNKAIHLMLKSNECGLLCKLNIEIAYDHVNWDFLLLVLKKMGLGKKWII